MGLIEKSILNNCKDVNFWEENDSFLIGKFNEFYKGDKSKGKEKSSKVMWCVFLISDDNSPYYKMPEIGEDNKFDFVFEEFLDNRSFMKDNKELCDELFKYFDKISSTSASRHLSAIEKLMDERTMFLNKQSYQGATIDRALELDKLMISTDKLTETFDKASIRLSKEKQTSSKGNLIKSATDKGVL